MRQIEMVGSEVEKLIPQRNPIRMVDTALFEQNGAVTTTLEVKAENIFVCDGCMQAVGIVEHIAQSAAALAGYDTYINNEPPKIGYIGEIRKFEVELLPKVGQSITTTVKVESVVGDITLISAQSCIDDKRIATTTMKIFLRQN